MARKKVKRKVNRNIFIGIGIIVVAMLFFLPTNLGQLFTNEKVSCDVIITNSPLTDSRIESVACESSGSCILPFGIFDFFVPSFAKDDLIVTLVSGGNSESKSVTISEIPGTTEGVKLSTCVTPGTNKADIKITEDSRIVDTKSITI